jgi:sugar lactone lactonase YvrE
MRQSTRVGSVGAILAAIAGMWISSLDQVFAQTVTTVAGGYVGDGGRATDAAFNYVVGVAEDKNGNYFVSDLDTHRIRMINPRGEISTIAGIGIAGYNGDGIPASRALIFSPAHMQFDPSGNLVFADSGNCRLRRIDSRGIITTIAGNGTCGYSGDGGPATAASVGKFYGIAFDGCGKLYLADLVSSVVRMVDTHGIIHTFAGNGTTGYSGDGGPATAAQLGFPIGLAADSSGNMYIADEADSVVRKVDPSGTITTFAGNGMSGYSGDGGYATQAAIGAPRGIAIKDGALYISNGGNARIRLVDLATNKIQTYVGSTPGYDGDGHLLTNSQLDRPSMLIFNAAGNIVFADTLNGRVREGLTYLSTLAGGYVGDGDTPTSAAFIQPEAVNFDARGNYYIADAAANRVRRVNAASGRISTVAGTGITGYAGDGRQATEAKLSYPSGVAADSSGNVYISDTFNAVIRKVDSDGTISTFAKNPNFGFLGPIKVDLKDNLYVADSSACVVWRITRKGIVSVFAGQINACSYNGDNIPATSAQLQFPSGLAFDQADELFIADSGNCLVRKVNSDGLITTAIGNGTCGFSGDGGTATSAELSYPIDVSVSSGNLYVADNGNDRIRKVSGGVISTFAGTGITGYNGEGMPALRTNFDDPVALAIDPNGALDVLDDFQNRLRQIQSK